MLSVISFAVTSGAHRLQTLPDTLWILHSVQVFYKRLENSAFNLLTGVCADLELRNSCHRMQSGGASQRARPFEPLRDHDAC